MISIQREPILSCIDQLMPLCHAAFELAGADFTGAPLELDLDLYQRLEDAGGLHNIVMRQDGHVIGMHWIMISPMPRHKGQLHAHTDAIYVMPEHRSHSRTLLAYSQHYLQSRAQYWTLANLSAKNNGEMWLRNGFDPIETIYFKKLG